MSANPPQHAAVLVNPVSGQARSRRRARKLLYYLARQGVSVVLHETTGPGDARAAAARLAGKVDAIVSIGGDGTLNEVLNGVVDARSRTPILVVSTGTANVVARELELPRKLPDLLKVLLEGQVRAVDLGAARTPGGPETRRFALCAGAGFDAAVVERVQKMRTAAGITRWTYAFPLVDALLRYPAPPMRVAVDGEVVEPQAVLTVIANTRRYGGEFQMCRKAVIDDGLLDVCCLNERGLGGLLKLGWRTLASGAPRLPGVNYYQGKAVDLDSTSRVPFHLDGDPAGELPVRIKVLPKAVNFFVRGAKA